MSPILCLYTWLSIVGTCVSQSDGADNPHALAALPALALRSGLVTTCASS
jgi:hypothetical protein